MTTQIGRKIYYELATGNVIIDTGERSGSVIETTIDQDFATFTALSERNRDTFDYIELPFGSYAQDFSECNGYSIDVATKTLKFSYPDPTQPQADPVYQKPLTEQIADLQKQLATSQEAIDFLLMGGM